MSFVPHHLAITAEHAAGNHGAGRLFFLPGSDGRANRLSQHFSDREVIPSDRQLNVYLGQIEKHGATVDVGAVATGMGCPSLDIVVTELILLGARSFIRVGTAGSLLPGVVSTGDLVIATGAVRDESTSDCYVAREYPAVADGEIVAALERAALGCDMGDHTFKGVVHSKDSLYSREMGYGPRQAINQDYMRQLSEIGVVASEMETAHLLVLSDVHSKKPVPLSTPAGVAKIRSGALLAVIGDHTAFSGAEQTRRAEEAAITIAIAAAHELFAGSTSE
jgi:uridine phosphorylase